MSSAASVSLSSLATSTERIGDDLLAREWASLPRTPPGRIHCFRRDHWAFLC